MVGSSGTGSLNDTIESQKQAEVGNGSWQGLKVPPVDHVAEKLGHGAAIGATSAK